MEKLRLAILDLYDNTPNQGMRCIKEIATRFEKDMDYKVYDVRGEAVVPSLEYDIYIASGGPGSPLDGDGVWDVQFFKLIDKIWRWNQSGQGPKKQLFFICHSFQMACRYFEIGAVTRRKSPSFGTFPVHLTEAGAKDPLFRALPDPFFAADFRHWQVTQPNEARMEELGASVLALEKIRPEIPLERAIMAVRFSEEIIGVQFHPEADPAGMLKHFQEEDRKKAIIAEHGPEKYERLVDDLNDPNKIALTYERILPVFLTNAIKMIRSATVLP